MDKQDAVLMSTLTPLPLPATSITVDGPVSAKCILKHRLLAIAAATVIFVLLRGGETSANPGPRVRSGLTTTPPRLVGQFGLESAEPQSYKAQLEKFVQRIQPVSNASTHDQIVVASLPRTPAFPNADMLDLLECHLDLSTSPACSDSRHIPPNIFATDKTVDPLSKSLTKWQQLNSNSTLYAWNDAQVSDWVRHVFSASHSRGNPIADLYDRLPINILKYDMFRLLTLLVYGGTYTDADTEPLKPISQWHIGAADLFEYDKTRAPSIVVAVEWAGKVEYNKYNPIYSRDVGLVQWTFSASPGHPVIVDALRQLVRHSELVLSGEYTDLIGTPDALPFDPEAPRAVLEWSGPAVLTNAIAR
ncbi:hypothetical protein OIV83_004754 [Microbotryomycetes sp. JL201]|nr:hypothetical protein OIV83_004754 [Microbotryomycetes sp. JL201]